MAAVRAVGATKTTTTVKAIAGGTNNNQLKAKKEAAEEMAEAVAAATVVTLKETATAIGIVTVTAMTPTLMPSALPLNAQQGGPKDPPS